MRLKQMKNSERRELSFCRDYVSCGMLCLCGRVNIFPIAK